MKASELQHLIEILIINPIASACKFIGRHSKFFLFYAGWAYITLMLIATTTNSVKVTLIVLVAPSVVLVVNAPVLWVRNRPERKAMRRKRMRETIARLERELEFDK